MTEASLALARDLGEDVKRRLGKAWGELPEEDRQAVTRALTRYAELHLRAARGEADPHAEAMLRATLLNWGFVGASVVRDAVRQAVMTAAEAGAKILVAMAKGLIA